jgi:hypothetical protein
MASCLATAHAACLVLSDVACRPSQSAERPHDQFAGFTADQDVVRSPAWSPPGEHLDQMATLKVETALTFASGHGCLFAAFVSTYDHPHLLRLISCLVTLRWFRVLVRVVPAAAARAAEAR